MYIPSISLYRTSSSIADACWLEWSTAAGQLCLLYRSVRDLQLLNHVCFLCSKLTFSLATITIYNAFQLQRSNCSSGTRRSDFNQL